MLGRFMSETLESWLVKSKQTEVEACIRCGAECYWHRRNGMWLFLEGDEWHVCPTKENTPGGFDDV